MTIFSIQEFNLIKNTFSKEKINNIFSKINNIILEGIGTNSKNNDIAYYIVITSYTINIIRSNFGFDKKDLHITLGFNKYLNTIIKSEKIY